MLREIVFIRRVGIPVSSQQKNREVLASVLANALLKQLLNNKACEYGYFLSVTKLISIGQGDNKFCSDFILFPIEFRCRLFLPVAGEVMTGVVHKMNLRGVFIRSGPMNCVYLSNQLMPNYNYVPGENPTFLGEDSSKIQVGVVIRYAVYAVRWIEDRWREFRVLATIADDGLGPVSSNGLDGMDL
ncbi:DNA-directed RNA polymerase V subunit 7-like [Andrographis paniculata]|uniref:DNA-directed RNA polymerase V subunit 7-like n=1 Tax=Andrographis paniculata TaxID=175694 RepID=UPI0021E990B5|nr:DNA-directed RNA polymerase V subunit 7-like [Andrographis paniculata]XP_051127726.1 DNA-directed RNA polymerase V subunit 7-like [Andrographis paniculata]XP_051127727.1 DNA-directed RNA polymerase V subunit 7-like [Andrographis paniculata]XP_051127728.1 DNA-directed RNA polymerase V subunit 7-like [Andrographis paniculata]XP_051127730.1 DNA-directed RNA polymerase V subunit 7-like [Andrographis paniculata]XP_051127731.1 DNA-directed RNA polymerase V subunit 7-like [Andrographis paniculata]